MIQRFRAGVVIPGPRLPRCARIGINARSPPSSRSGNFGDAQAPVASWPAPRAGDRAPVIAFAPPLDVRLVLLQPLLQIAKGSPSLHHRVTFLRRERCEDLILLDLRLERRGIPIEILQTLQARRELLQLRPSL